MKRCKGCGGRSCVCGMRVKTAGEVAAMVAPTKPERCSCPESLHLRAALERIGKVCTEWPDSTESWMAVAALVDAAMALEELP